MNRDTQAALLGRRSTFFLYIRAPRREEKSWYFKSMRSPGAA